jgi:hypothetical protein
MPVKYYLCESGDAKHHADKHRDSYITLRRNLLTLVESLGAKNCRFCPDMMLLTGVFFLNDPPQGWTKKSQYGSRPKYTKANANILTHFTPKPPYQVIRHPELQALWDWLKCPSSYEYTVPGTTTEGSSSISRYGNTHEACWISEQHPVLLVLPDLLHAKEEAAKGNHVIKGNTLDWVPPEGMREIMREEWDLMKAQYNHAEALRRAGK